MWVRFNQDDGENKKDDFVDVLDDDRYEDVVKRKVAGGSVSPHTKMAFEEAPTEVVVSIKKKYDDFKAIKKAKLEAIEGEIVG